MPDGAARPLVVMVADTTWHGHRLAAQNIAVRLARYARVLYAGPPLTPAGILRRRRLFGDAKWVGLEQVDSDGELFQVGCIAPPGKTRPVGRELTRRALVAQIQRAARVLGGNLHAVVQIPVHYPVLGAFDTRRRIHCASDDFVAAAGLNNVDVRWVEAGERQIARDATSVIAVSETLVEKWRGYGFEPSFIPNGCDHELFGTTDSVTPAPDVELKPPIAGFIGTISDRTDVGLLRSISDRGWSILIVGPRSFTAPGEELDELFARPNVQWLGPRDFRLLPTYLAHVRVGLVPYRKTTFSDASFPLKTLDYLAAGRPVVGMELPALHTVGDDVVTIASDADSFVDAVEHHLREPIDPEGRAKRMERAALFSWDARAAEFAEALGLVDAESTSRH